MKNKTRQKALSDFFKKEYSNLVLFVQRLISDTAARDSQDIVQDVAFNLFSATDISIPIENLSAYIYRAIRNRVVDEFRKRKKDTVSLEEKLYRDGELTLADVIQDTCPDMSKVVVNNEIRNQLYKAIDTLNEEQKAIIIETEFENRSFRELSEEWDIPIGTLLARKSRGLQSIRTALAAPMT